MKLIALILIVGSLAAVALLSVLMFRRDESILGLAALVAALFAAFAAVAYTAVGEI